MSEKHPNWNAFKIVVLFPLLLGLGLAKKVKFARETCPPMRKRTAHSIALFKRDAALASSASRIRAVGDILARASAIRSRRASVSTISTRSPFPSHLDSMTSLEKWQSPDAIRTWWEQDHQKQIKRPWSAELVSTLRQPLPMVPVANPVAMKLRRVLQRSFETKTGTLTFGELALVPHFVSN